MYVSLFGCTALGSLHEIRSLSVASVLLILVLDSLCLGDLRDLILLSAA